MTEYTCYEVRGFYKHNSYDLTGQNFLEALKGACYGGHTTKDFFKGQFLSNACIKVVYYADNQGKHYEPNIVYIKEKIEHDKLVIFPVSSKVYMDDVVHYLELGFKVWFMKAKDYKQFKKDYAMSM